LPQDVPLTEGLAIGLDTGRLTGPEFVEACPPPLTLWPKELAKRLGICVVVGPNILNPFEEANCCELLDPW
jgi:hypothetical protein